MLLPRWLGLSCVLLALLLAACSGSKPESAATTRTITAEDVQTVLADALAGRLPTHDALVAQLGPPVRTRAASEGGPQTLIYYGVEFIVQPPAPVNRMALTDARYTSPEGLRVGYAREFVRTTLGPPSHQEPTQMTYEKAGPPACTLLIFLEGDKVSRLEWRFDS